LTFEGSGNTNLELKHRKCVEDTT